MKKSVMENQLPNQKDTTVSRSNPSSKKKNRQRKLIQTYLKLYKKGHSRLARLFYLTNRVIYSCDIFPSVQIGEQFHLMHFGLGVVIHPYTIIGNNVWIYQQVTVGVKHHADYFCLKIEDNVFIGAGAKILGEGEMTIGENAVIGANSVVLKSVPANAVVVGNPARIVKLNGVKVDIKL